jgi:hypothetical protein
LDFEEFHKAVNTFGRSSVPSSNCRRRSSQSSDRGHSINPASHDVGLNPSALRLKCEETCAFALDDCPFPFTKI